MPSAGGLLQTGRHVAAGADQLVEIPAAAQVTERSPAGVIAPTPKAYMVVVEPPALQTSWQVTPSDAGAKQFPTASDGPKVGREPQVDAATFRAQVEGVAKGSVSHVPLWQLAMRAFAEVGSYPAAQSATQADPEDTVAVQEPDVIAPLGAVKLAVLQLASQVADDDDQLPAMQNTVNVPASDCV